MVARILGKLLHMVGILPTDKVTEVQRTDLVGEFVGHTGPKTRRKVAFRDSEVFAYFPINILSSMSPRFEQICRSKKLKGGFFLLMKPID